MIFVTIGTQLPFPRLVTIMDRIAPVLGEEIVAQIGSQAELPKNMRWEREIRGSAFDELWSQSRCVVAHAGVGSILTAMRRRKPLIVVPRRAKLSEHRNDHQLATAAQAEKIKGVYRAEGYEEILGLLQEPHLETSSGAESDRLRDLKDEIRRQLIL